MTDNDDLSENECSNAETTAPEVPAPHSHSDSVEVEFFRLREVVSDSGLLHSLCLEAFKIQADGQDSLASQSDLEMALAHIFSSCHLDRLDADEISELWSGSLNFAGFYMICHELLKALHQAVNLDGGSNM